MRRATSQVTLSAVITATMTAIAQRQQDGAGEGLVDVLLRRWRESVPSALLQVGAEHLRCTSSATTSRVAAPASTTSPIAANSRSAQPGLAPAPYEPARAHPGPSPVADPAHGQDVAGVGRVVAELAANVSDVDVDQVLVADPAAAPDVFDQLGSGERQAGSGGQGIQDVELGAGQLHGYAAEVDLAGLRGRW